MENVIDLGPRRVIYHLVRRRWSRTIRMTIKSSGEVRVSAPTLMPVRFIESFMQAKSDWLLKKLAYFDTVEKVQPRLKLTPEKVKALKVQTLEIITPKLTAFGSLLSVKWRRVTVKNITSRWGSCSRFGNLSFNCRMALLPEDLVDYIVVHELCHLRQFNHSSKFWAIVSSIIPDYKIKVKHLRQHVLALS